MKIRKFNESIIIDIALEYNYISIDDVKLQMFTHQDLKGIHNSGMKIYTITNSFKLVEIVSAQYIRNLRYKRETLNDHFPGLLIITEEYSPTILKLLEQLKELDKLHNEEMNLRFKTIIGISQRDMNKLIN